MSTAARKTARIFLLSLPALVGLAFVLDEIIGSGGVSARSLIDLIGPACFVWALFEGASLIWRVRDGDHYGPRLVAGLRRAAAALLLGAFGTVILSPSLHHLIGNNFTAMTGVAFDISVEAVTLASVGLLLEALARASAATHEDVGSIL